MIDSLDDATLPLSFGAERLSPLNAMLIAAGGAGGSVQDLSFIPQYRDDFGITGSTPECASWTWRRDALLDGHEGNAPQNWPDNFFIARPGHDECEGADKLKLIAQAQAGQQVKSSVYSSADIADARQNLLRWAGNLQGAQQVAKHWQSITGDKSATSSVRLGEIDFLVHKYNAAAAEFGVAVRRSLLWNGGQNTLDSVQAELDQGASLLAAGRNAEGAQLLRLLDHLATQGYGKYKSSAFDQDTALQFASVSYFACEQLADYERETGDLHAAAEDYECALSWTSQINAGSGVRPEVLNNNAALAHLGLGETGAAASLEAKALASDPENPVFLMTAGFIAERSGKKALAAQYDRHTLISDPGAFPAANDLGVESSRQSQDSAAVAAFRRAVGANQSYALAWFNLGVIESTMGPTHLLASQGAFARAYSLDPALKNRQAHTTIDGSVYRTALDLSKPLPPRWSFSQLSRPAPAVAAGLLAIVTLGLGKASAGNRTTVADRWLDPISERLSSMAILARFRHPTWAIVATVATFLLARLHRGVAPSELMPYVLGVLILVGAAMTARLLVARARGIAIAQQSWLPGIFVGLLSGAIGLPWAPLSVVVAKKDSNVRLHAAAPITMAVLSFLLFVEFSWLHIPLTHDWAVAALIMSASTLLPIGPLDGARLGKTGLVAGAGVIGGALLVGLGLI